MKRERLTDTETFHLEIPADENNLGEVRDFISDICSRAGFSNRDTSNTKLAVDEACTNIIKHAYQSKGGEIRIDVQAEPGKIEINIFDRGEAFDWSRIEDPDLHQYVEMGKKGGLGIYLMNRLMDDIDYHSSDAGNKLFMAKSIAGAAGAPRPLFMPSKPKWTSTLRFKFGLRATLGLLGLVVLLGTIQLSRQKQDIGLRRNQEWTRKEMFTRNLAGRSRDFIDLDNLFDVEFTKFRKDVTSQVKSYPEVTSCVIINNDNTIVYSTDTEALFDEYLYPPGMEEIPTTGDWRMIRDQTRGNIREFHHTIRSRNGVTLGRVVLGFSEANVEGNIDDPRLATVFILAGIFAAGIFLISLLVSIFVKPIQALTDGVRAIGEGALTDVIEIDGPEEIGAIARAFNEITTKFREAQESVVEQERFQKEMQVAQEIQHTLLPKEVPKISGYDIASLYRAAKEVGGDYFDFVNVDDDTTGVVVADVSGKGVPGSLVMTIIRTALRMEARGNFSAAEVMTRMNDFVTEDMKKGMFVTIFYVILDSKNRIISYASAGHNPMILYRAESDETFFLNPRGFPVGISLPDDTLFRRSIDVEKIKLKKNDMLVIYTDGVTEAMNENREQYGEERLIRLIKKCGGLSTQGFIDRLNEDIKNFTGEEPQNDDITVVAIKEKLMADEVLFGIRKKLLDLVEVGGLTVAEACRKMRVSPSTYYRYRKRLLEMGERGLKNKELRREHEIKRVSLEQRKEIIEIIKQYPAYGAKRLSVLFNERKVANEHLTPSLIYDELKRMRLNTYEKRLEYLRRNKIISEEQFHELRATPPRKVKLKLKPAPQIEGAPEIPEILGPVSPEMPPVEVPKPAASVPPPIMRPAMEAAPSGPGVVREFEFTGDEGGNIEVDTEELSGGVVLITVKGHLDSSSAGELEGILESIYEFGYRKIVVSLKEVSYISSGGWGIFTGRVKTLRERDGDVVLVGMSSEVYDIYELLGFQDIIMHFHGTDEALEYISLPTEERRKRLKEVTLVRAKAAPFEQRLSEPAAGEPAEDEAALVWTPLKITAGTVGENGEITVLDLEGVIDTVSCGKLREIMDDFIGKGNLKLVIDMSRVEYVSSAGWGVFASRIDEIREGGGDLKIFGMDQEVDNIFHMLGFDAIMRSFSVLAEAIEDFERPTPTMAASDFMEEPPEPIDYEKISRESFPVQEEKEAVAAEMEVSRTGEEARGCVVLRIKGAVDASTTDELEIWFERFALKETNHLVIDLSDVIYISSGGWGVIVRCMQSMQTDNRMLIAAGMNPIIFKIFCDLGFEMLIAHFVTVEDAVASTLDMPVEEIAERMTEEGPADAPSVERTAIEPLKPHVPEKMDSKVIFIDFAHNKDVRSDSDKQIREIGWKEYGKKLIERNERLKRRKK